MGRKRGRERSRGGVFLAGKTFDVLFRETIREEGGSEMSTLLELLIPLQRATRAMLASYEFS